jgi:hypothetical protein
MSSEVDIWHTQCIYHFRPNDRRMTARPDAHFDAAVVSGNRSAL